MADKGYKIVAVSDSKGGIYRKDGLDPRSLKQYKDQSRKLEGVYCEGSGCELVEHEKITNNELLELDVDALVLAALENQITEDNAPDIKAGLILELANGPVTPRADQILFRKGIDVIPDILANAGGVTVSYFEWVQNRAGFYWEEEEVQERLKTIMHREARKIKTEADNNRDKGMDLRTAAYVHGLGRIAEAIDSQGTKDYFKSQSTD